jgi:hypothetical protein
MSTLKVNTIESLNGGSVTIIGDTSSSGSFSGSFEGTTITTTSGSIGDLSVTRITETSALIHKTEIENLSNDGKIYQLRPVNFKWKEDQRKDVGLIAEEVAELYPELVKTDEKGNALGVNYSKLTAVLIKTVQDLNSRIENLETQLSNLKG